MGPGEPDPPSQEMHNAQTEEIVKQPRILNENFVEDSDDNSLVASNSDVRFLSSDDEE